MKVGIARYAVPGGKAAGRNCQSVGLTTFVAPAIRARTAQRAVPTKLTHYPAPALVVKKTGMYT